jgi:hypothetical protein
LESNAEGEILLQPLVPGLLHMIVGCVQLQRGEEGRGEGTQLLATAVLPVTSVTAPDLFMQAR